MTSPDEHSQRVMRKRLSASPSTTAGVGSSSFFDSFSINFASLLSTSATRASLLVGRDLSADEMRTLEEELERDIATQMAIDEKENDEEANHNNMNTSRTSSNSLNASICSIQPAEPKMMRTPKMQRGGAAGGLLLSPAPQSSSQQRTRQSFTERAAAIVTPLKASIARASLASPFAHQEIVTPMKSSAVASPAITSSSTATFASPNIQRIMQSPARSAMQECIRTVQKEQLELSIDGNACGVNQSQLVNEFLAAPASSVEAIAFPQVDGPESIASSSLPTSLLNRTPLHLRRSTSTSPISSPSSIAASTVVMSPISSSLSPSASPSASSSSSQADLIFSLEDKISLQHSQILQAGMLGQQLITEMEEMQDVHAREVEVMKTKIDDSASTITQLKTELERALTRLTSTEKTNAEYQRRLQSLTDEHEVMHQENVRWQSKVKVMEAQMGSERMKGEEERKQVEKQYEMKLKEAITLQQSSEIRFTSLQSSHVQLTSDLTYTQEELFTLQTRVDELMREVKEKDEESKKRKMMEEVNQQAMSELQIKYDTLLEQHNNSLLEHASSLEHHSHLFEQESNHAKTTEKKCELMEEKMREMQEKMEGMRGQMKQMEGEKRVTESSPSVITTCATTITATSSSSSLLHSPQFARSIHRGKNARLSGMKYSSLLSELEAELEGKDVGGDVEVEKNEEIIVVTKSSDSVVESPAESIGETSTIVATASSQFTTPLPSSTLSSSLRARSDSNASSSTATARKLLLDIEDALEGDSPNHPRVEACSQFLGEKIGGQEGMVVKRGGKKQSSSRALVSSSASSSTVATPSSLIKPHPSSARRLSAWLSEKVTDAENTLRPILAFSLTKDGEGREDDDEEEEESLEETNENARSRGGSVSNAPTPAVAIKTVAVTIEPIIEEPQPSTFPATLDTTTSSPTDLPSPPPTTEVLREYFHLTTLSIKLSSCNENIRSCNTSVNQLYNEAIEKDIPFAFWHQWISEKLEVISKEANEKEKLRPRVTPMKTTPLTPAAGNLSMVTPAKAPNMLSNSRMTTPSTALKSGVKPSATAVTTATKPPLGNTNRVLTPIPSHRGVINATPQSVTKTMKMTSTPATTTVAAATTPMSQPRAAGINSDMKQPLSENTRIINHPQQSNTPSSSSSSTSSHPIKSLQHRPQVRGLDRLDQRQSNASSSTTSLLHKFSNFVTATPIRRPAPTSEQQQ